MKTFHRYIDTEPVAVHVIEREADLDEFRQFIRSNLRILAVDSETTGLDIFSETFRLRTVQFGHATEAYVVPAELGPVYEHEIVIALRAIDRLVLHNAAYDFQVFDRTLGVTLEELWPKAIDTKIFSHLVDPRGQDEGGVGQSLEALTGKLIDPSIGEGVKGLMSKVAREFKTTKAKIWARVPLWHPDYLLYAGFDPMLAFRLLQILGPMVPRRSRSLIAFEHKVSEVCSKMERNGFRLDVPYTQRLSTGLLAEEERLTALALSYGCENVNSTEQVADVLEARGVKIKGRTETGKRKVDKVLLSELVAAGDEFAEAVVDAKRARKWRSTWVDGFLAGSDADDRVHPSINPLRARTARMSITGIPAQTLPSSDWMIRRCFVADEGHVLASVDYEAQELRVLAALSGDRTMKTAFRQGADLHQLTADAAGVARKVGKMANFLQVYGGGAGSLATQAGIDFPTANRVVETFKSTYPGVADLSQRQAAAATSEGYIYTPTGRRLPVDANRAYSALNYLVQSTSRDVTCSALLRLDEAGFTPYLRLPIHDEVIASVPADQAEWGAAEIGRLMEMEMSGVRISTDPSVGDTTWGYAYVDRDDPDQVARYESTLRG